ncbi:chorismate mutase, partial [TM7 phylum sp. oral taxon 349]
MTQSKNITVAIQGQAGSFHEQAAHQWYGAQATIVPCVTFRDAFDAYANGAA